MPDWSLVVAQPILLMMQSFSLWASSSSSTRRTVAASMYPRFQVSGPTSTSEHFPSHGPVVYSVFPIRWVVYVPSGPRVKVNPPIRWLV